MMEMASDAMRYVVPVLITVIIGPMIARRSKGHTDETDEQDSPSTPGEHWQQLVDQMQSWTDKRLAERDAKIERLDKRVTSLESRYRAALAFIRTLIRRHPDSSDDIPAEIRHDL